MWSKREWQVIQRMLELVVLDHRLATSTGGYGVGEVGTGAGERVDWMVNGTNLTPRQGREAVGEAGSCGAETRVNTELVEAGRFVESYGKWFSEVVLG